MKDGAEKCCLSVIVPVYQAKRYLKRCIESILRQSFRDLELILVDDGSTDGSSELCDWYAAQDARVRVIHKENGGVTSARKAGTAIAAGRYVTFADSDDWMEQKMYERALRCLQTSDADLLLMGYKEDSADGSSVRVRGAAPNGIYEGARKEEQLKRGLVIPSLWCKFFQRELICAKIKKVDERIVIGEDLLCTYACILDADRIQVHNLCMYHYVQNEESRTHSYNAQCIGSLRHLSIGLKKLCRQKNASALKDMFNAVLVKELLFILKNEFGRHTCWYLSSRAVKRLKKRLSCIALEKILIGRDAVLEMDFGEGAKLLAAYRNKQFRRLHVMLKRGGEKPGE